MTDPDYFSHVRREILPLMTRANRCLEIGCGSGRTLEWLKANGMVNWTGGIDVQKDLEMSPLDFFAAGNVEAMDFPQNLDVILCLDILEHLLDPAAVLARLRSCLNPGGYLIASIPNVANFRVAIPLLFGKWTYRDSGMLDRTHLRFFTRSSATDILASAGFQVETIRATAYGLDIPMRVLTLNQVPMFHCQYLFKARLCNGGNPA